MAALIHSDQIRERPKKRRGMAADPLPGRQGKGEGKSAVVNTLESKGSELWVASLREQHWGCSASPSSLTNTETEGSSASLLIMVNREGREQFIATKAGCTYM